MIILVASQKGGCGKSTTSVNICAELARANKDVVLLDADKQEHLPVGHRTVMRQRFLQ